MKKAIVTGATGFIGKFLVRELVKQNVEVIAVVRRGTKNLNTINALPVKIVECNIADYHMLPDMIADRDIDVVFHIAWQGVSDLDARNEAIQMQNLQSTLDLIDAMHIMRIGCFIGCGSMHEAESLVEMNEDKVISNLGYMYKATSKIMLVTSTIQYFLQILILVFLKNYYVYLIVVLVTQIANNLITAAIVQYKYPNYVAMGELEKDEVKQINCRIRDLFTSKLGGVIVNSADTVVISAFLGLTKLAIYQNYYFIITSVIGVVGIVFSSCTAGIMIDLDRCVRLELICY